MKQNIKPWKITELGDKITHCYEAHGVQLSIKKKDTNISDDRIIFRIKLKYGTRVNDIEKYAGDVQMKLKLPFFNVITKEMDIYIVTSKEPLVGSDWLQILTSREIRERIKRREIVHLIGTDAAGRVIINELTKYPHIVMVGTTGSGKSAAVKTLLVGLLLYYLPDKVNIIVCDLADELLEFNGFPHN